MCHSYKGVLKILSKVYLTAQATGDTLTVEALDHVLNWVKLADKTQGQSQDMSIRLPIKDIEVVFTDVEIILI